MISFCPIHFSLFSFYVFPFPLPNTIWDMMSLCWCLPTPLTFDPQVGYGTRVGPPFCHFLEGLLIPVPGKQWCHVVLSVFACLLKIAAEQQITLQKRGFSYALPLDLLLTTIHLLALSWCFQFLALSACCSQLWGWCYSYCDVMWLPVMYAKAQRSPVTYSRGFINNCIVFPTRANSIWEGGLMGK